MNGGHPNREEDFDLLALGALEGAEKREIESHVASCADCERKLAAARGRVAMLALAAPEVKPSPEVKARLMRQVRAASATPAAAPPVVPATPRRPLETTPAKGGLFGGWWASLLAPVATILVIGIVFLWQQNERLKNQLAVLQATVQTQQTQLAEDIQVESLTALRDTVVVPLAQQAGQPAGSARVIYNAQRGLLVYDGQLETAPAKKSYQLWLVPAKGNPISAGVFNPSTGKTSHWLIMIPPGTPAKAFAVTLEPVNGSTQPTGPKVLVGPVS